MKPVVAITGAAGLIGQYLLKTAARWGPRGDVRGLTRADMDLTDSPAVERYWSSMKPDTVIHCAALSRTKDCERHPDQAWRVNVEATARLARLSERIPFLFLSSGEVFDGTRGWYSEADAPHPINVYGRTKLDAERAVLENPRHTVVRIVLTAGTFLRGDRSFVEDMSRAATSGRTVTLYADEFRCPLPAGAVARAIWELIDRGPGGLYHLGGRERLSRWEIGEALLPWYPELNSRLVSGTARSHSGAPRPADLSLRCEKIQRLLSFTLPGFREWLTARTLRGPDLWDYPEEEP